MNGTRSALGEIRTWWFALAFVCIGLETRFVELLTTEQGRPALAFIAAQSINVGLDAAAGLAAVRRRDLRAAGDQLTNAHSSAAPLIPAYAGVSGGGASVYVTPV